MEMAILFYVGLFAFIFFGIWLSKNQKVDSPKTTLPPKIAQNSFPPLTPNGILTIIVGGIVGLIVVIGLAWLGGKFGSGNSLFPAGASNYQPPTYQPSHQPPNSYQSTPDAVWVNGYYRHDGTYVPGHYRSRADGDPSNNWSTYPNVNPYTGKVGTRKR